MTDDAWIHDPDSYIIASMRDCQNQAANARLISLAPEMAEALLAFVQWADGALAERNSEPTDHSGKHGPRPAVETGGREVVTSTRSTSNRATRPVFSCTLIVGQFA